MEALGWAGRDHYRYGEHHLAVRATDAGFLARIRHCLAPYLVDEGPGDTVFSADCGVDRVLAGGRVVRGKGRLYFGELLIFTGPSQVEMAGRLVGGFRDLVTVHNDGFVRCRAAAVTVDGTALLLPSPPSAHLPALAGLLVRAGAGYLGDELAYVDPVLHRVHGPRLPLLIDVDDLVHFPELEAGQGGRRPRRPPAVAGARTPRRPVPVGDLGGREPDAAPLGRIAFPVFAPGERTRFEPVSRAEAVFGLTGSILNMHVWGERALLVTQRLLDDVPAERLVVGSLTEAADALTARTTDRVAGR